MAPSRKSSSTATRTAPAAGVSPARRRQAVKADAQLGDLIGYRIRRLNTLLTQHIKLVGDRLLGLTLAQSRVLFELGVKGAGNPGAIAEATGLERSHVTHAVRDLVERGLVAKQSDARDGRGVLLSITARGRELLDRGVAAGTVRRQSLETALSAEELRAFDRILTKLTTVAEQLVASEPGQEGGVAPRTLAARSTRKPRARPD